jgi:biotin transport system substrate-specific component
MPVRIAVLSPPSTVLRRSIAVAAGAALVAAASQVAVPLPGTPVPMTLQPLAVLVVGGLLGAELGAASLVLYLALGAAGVPVFTPFGLPGAARLFGPTGGYLLAYPVAAYAVGRLAGAAPGYLRAAGAALAGLVLIHLGGLVQLGLLTGSVEQAARFGTLPFLIGDAAKLGIATLVLAKLASSIRARL